MLINIFSHTPVWVWGLLAALAALGLSQLRTRRVGRGRVLALPLALLALGLWSMAPAFAAQPATAAVWLLALAAGAGLGSRIPRPAGTVWLAAQRQFHLPGSWLPLVLMLAIFSLRYGVGVGQALHPAWRSDAGVLLPVAALYGAISGLLLGRALGLLQLARAAQPAAAKSTATTHGHSMRNNPQPDAGAGQASACVGPGSCPGQLKNYPQSGRP